MIASLSRDTIAVRENNASITIAGSGFGSTPQVNLPQGWTLGSQGNGANIVILISVGPSAKLGANAISVTVNGIKSNDASIDVTADVRMKLERVGPTVISSDGKYSEDTTIRVTAVRTATGETLVGFTGSVNIAEDGTAIYSQNGGTLPSSVEITSGGTVMFIANSLAGPSAEGESGLPPDPAKIKATNYPVYGGNSLDIPQWVVPSTKLHDLAASDVYAWVQARAKDIFVAASGDVSTVLSAISGYTTNAQRGGGSTGVVRGPQSLISINPYYTASRLNSVSLNNCGFTGIRWFTGVLLHEGRHAYQGFAAMRINNQDYDGDLDWLVTRISVAPSNILLDTCTPRTVCNQETGDTPSKAYHGDTIFDTAFAPDYSSYAAEMDAWTFMSIHGR